MQPSKPRILIVDDNASNLEGFEALLGGTYELLAAMGGAEALEIALAGSPDLILLDILMPDLDGYEVCRRLKADRRTAEIPVIFCTSLDQAVDEARGLELGAIDFLQKPCSPPVIQARVRNHIRMKLQGDRLRDMSFIDGLTEVPNRRRFDQFLDQEWRRGTHSHAPLSLILMDIDFFKAYNDALGHPSGDDCLRRIAQGLAKMVKRPGDLLARYGGEEFVCVLSDTDRAGVLEVADRLREAVAGLAIPHPDSSLSPFVTLSLGLATLVPTMDTPAAELIRLADQALYAAKAGGRNRAVAAT